LLQSSWDAFCKGSREGRDQAEILNSLGLGSRYCCRRMILTQPIALNMKQQLHAPPPLSDNEAHHRALVPPPPEVAAETETEQTPGPKKKKPKRGRATEETINS